MQFLTKSEAHLKPCGGPLVQSMNHSVKHMLQATLFEGGSVTSLVASTSDYFFASLQADVC
jgi:hypothetical protein